MVIMGMTFPPGGVDENDTSHFGTFDAVRGNFAASSGRGSPFHSLGACETERKQRGCFFVFTGSSGHAGHLVRPPIREQPPLCEPNRQSAVFS